MTKNIFKLNQLSDSLVYFTSDLHLGHDKPFIWNKRGFGGHIEHDDSVIDTINNTVGEDDILFHLGDFCLNTMDTEFECFLDRILCKNIYMLWGNHNNPYRKVYQGEVEKIKQIMGGQTYTGCSDMEIYPLRYKNVINLGHYVEVMIGGQIFVLFHYPIIAYNHMSVGGIHLCGHSHYELPLSRADFPGNRILDVGWDGHRKPLKVSEVLDIIKNKNIK